MKKEEVAEMFEELREGLNFHSRNAEDKEDFIERANELINQLEEKYTER